MTEAEQIMKRCQAGTRNYEEANNLHAACYGIIGKLLAQPEQEPNWAWICNECGAQEFTSALCKTDLDYLACSGCGSNEFHKEALAQPEQEPVVRVICKSEGSAGPPQKFQEYKEKNT